MYLGKTIRIIRQNKNIPLNTAYKNILSRQVSIQFEKGSSDTTVNKFLRMLENLNITLEEFESFYLEGENKNTYFTDGYIKAFNNKDINRLIQLKEEAQKDYFETNNEKFNHFYAIISILIIELNNSTDYKKYILILHNYLFHCNTWGYYEITLFNNSLPYYTNELIDLVYSKAITVLHNSPNKNRYRNENAFLLCNILEIKILSKDIKSTKFYLNELQSLKLETNDNIQLQIMIKYFTAIFEYISYQKNEEIIFEILNIFEFLDLESDKLLYKNFYIRIKDLYK